MSRSSFFFSGAEAGAILFLLLEPEPFIIATGAGAGIVPNITGCETLDYSMIYAISATRATRASNCHIHLPIF